MKNYLKSKLARYISKWGGKTRDDVSVDTDFVVLGQPPKVLQKPTFEEMQIDPEAMNKYEASLKKSELYKEIQSQAQAFSMPVFNTERFLYFTGCKSQINKP